MPAIITSESTGLQVHFLPNQLPKDQEAFLEIATAVLHHLLGPFRPLSNMEVYEDDGDVDIGA